MIKPCKDFIAEVTVRLSSDMGDAAERRFAFKPGMTYDDYMQMCSNAYSIMRHTVGADTFDSMTTDVTDEVKEDIKDNVHIVDNLGC